MSWYLEYHCATKADASQTLDDKAGAHTPPSVVSAIKLLIEALPDTDAHDIYVRTHGHMDQGRNRSDVQILVYLQPDADTGGGRATRDGGLTPPEEAA